MSRYTGPRLKIMRALGLELPGLSRKNLLDRFDPPGQHGAKTKRKSDYGLHLMEKQKLRMNYGLTERQMRRLVQEARTAHGAFGEKIAEFLERRLDNVVFRAGFSPSIPAARQLVNHKHFLVNGRPVNIPSYRVKLGDTVTLCPASAGLLCVKETLDEPVLTRPEWLHWEEQTRTAHVTHLPAADDIPFPVSLQMVVEYYSRQL
jgi:small subunit ribosomal protein S4